MTRSKTPYLSGLTEPIPVPEEARARVKALYGEYLRAKRELALYLEALALGLGMADAELDAESMVLSNNGYQDKR